MLDSDMPSRLAPASVDGKRTERMTGGLLGSGALHLLMALLLVFGLPMTLQAPPPEEQVVPVNLVRLGAKTAAPPAPVKAPIPQEKAREVAKSAPAAAVPVAQTPPAQAAPRQAEARAPPELLTAIRPERKPPVPKPAQAVRPAAAPAAQRQRQTAPVDELTTRLNRLALLRQPAPPMPPDPRLQDGAGLSNLAATSANAARARDATYSVKDFIRAQVERRWNLDRTGVMAGDWVVAIHILLRPDGTVRAAEIVDTPRYRSDQTYRNFALSARNAVLLSSPLTVPPGEYDIAKDIVLDFHSRQVME